MIELLKQALVGQFDAALSMMHDSVKRCPADQWEQSVGNFPFWHVAYHLLFYVDLYLSRDEHSFRPQGLHRENYQFFGQLPWPPHEEVKADVPLEKTAILEYIQHCREKAVKSIESETAESLQGPSGFSWYPISRVEFHINNIRHVQHHAAQMSLALRRSVGLNVGWVGTGFREAENG